MAETKAPTESQLAKQRARNAQPPGPGFSFSAGGGEDSSFRPQRFPGLLASSSSSFPSPSSCSSSSPSASYRFDISRSPHSFRDFPPTKRVEGGGGNPPGSLVYLP